MRSSLQALHQLRLSPPLINVIASFLSGRRDEVNWLLPDLLYFFTRDCSQDSSPGPFLWLAFLKTLLRTFLFEFSTIVAYVDEVLLIVWGPTRELFEQRGNRVLDFTQNWARTHKITINFNKSHCIAFGKTKIFQQGTLFKLHGKNIKSENTINYLGLKIDQHFSFLPHLTSKRQKFKNVYKFLSISGRFPHIFLKIGTHPCYSSHWPVHVQPGFHVCGSRMEFAIFWRLREGHFS